MSRSPSQAPDMARQALEKLSLTQKLTRAEREGLRRKDLEGINDRKLLSREQREAVARSTPIRDWPEDELLAFLAGKCDLRAICLLDHPQGCGVGVEQVILFARNVKMEEQRFRFAASRQGEPRVTPLRRDLLDTLQTGLYCRGPWWCLHDKYDFVPMPQPYLPCTVPFDQLKPTRLSDLLHETHHRGKVLIVRWASTKLADQLSTNAVVEDAFGDTELIHIFHLDTQAAGYAPFATMEPYFTFDGSKTPELRIDHPSDLVELNLLDGRVPSVWRYSLGALSVLDCKAAGNGALKAGDHFSALQSYTLGLCIFETSTSSELDEALQKDLFRNRAHVNLLLHRYDAAKADALASLVKVEDSGDEEDRSAQLDGKAYYRAGLAAYAIGDFEEALTLFKQQLSLTPRDTEGLRQVQRTEHRLIEKQTPPSVEALRKLISPRKPSLDVSDHTSNVVVHESVGKGRGLFATTNIRAGESVCCENAFAAILGDDDKDYSANKFKYDPRLPNSMRYGSIALWQRTYQDIVRRNSYQIGEEHNSAVFITSSYANHSCVPNAARKHLGNVLVLQATKPIKHGEEIVVSYNPDAPDEHRKQVFPDIWGFQCTCLLCEAEGNDTEADRNRRNVLAAQIHDFNQKHLPGGINNQPSKQLIAKAEKLAAEVAATYNPDIWAKAPRRSLSTIHSWLITARLSQRAKTQEACIAVLRSLAYEVIETPAFSVRTTEGTAVTPEGFTALSFLSAVKLKTGDKNAAKVLEDMAEAVFGVVGMEGEFTRPALLMV